MTSLKVAILGATGMIGQFLILCVERHNKEIERREKVATQK